MGVVSAAALEAGGNVVGVMPYAMFASGGEKAQTETDVVKPKKAADALFDGQNRDRENVRASALLSIVCLPDVLAHVP